MTQPDKPWCETCRYLKADDRPGFHTSGNCRRYPPIVVETVSFDGAGGNYFSQHWPWMAPTDWCGEYQETPDAR